MTTSKRRRTARDRWGLSSKKSTCKTLKIMKKKSNSDSNSSLSLITCIQYIEILKLNTSVPCLSLLAYRQSMISYILRIMHRLKRSLLWRLKKQSLTLNFHIMTRNLLVFNVKSVLRSVKFKIWSRSLQLLKMNLTLPSISFKKWIKISLNWNLRLMYMSLKWLD